MCQGDFYYMSIRYIIYEPHPKEVFLEDTINEYLDTPHRYGGFGKKRSATV